MRRLCIVLPLVLITCSCVSPEQRRHIGRWEATGVGRDQYVIVFAANDKAQVTTPNGTYDGTYLIDYTTTPIRLNVTWDDKTVKCIMEFLNDESFKVIGEDEPGKLRPLDFEPAEDIVVFVKTDK
ncbi:MAG: hypothetical protein JW720_11515 [Sedimentisphaerales bacterium]|nr:hypothetical protein [Sedimentisphaerales bacterium]